MRNPAIITEKNTPQALQPRQKSPAELHSVRSRVESAVRQTVEGVRTITEITYANAYLPITGKRQTVEVNGTPIEARAEMILTDGTRLTFQEDFRGHPNPGAASYHFGNAFAERMKAEWFKWKDAEVDRVHANHQA